MQNLAPSFHQSGSVPSKLSLCLRYIAVFDGQMLERETELVLLPGTCKSSNRTSYIRCYIHNRTGRTVIRRNVAHFRKPQHFLTLTHQKSHKSPVGVALTSGFFCQAIVILDKHIYNSSANNLIRKIVFFFLVLLNRTLLCLPN